MFKAVLYDLDGMLVMSPDGRFSTRLSETYDVSYKQELLPFFQGVFQKCLVGKAELKEELPAFLPRWNWTGSVDELLSFWFSTDHVFDEKLLKHIANLREKGVLCFGSTNNEKYRTTYIWETAGLKGHLDGLFSSSALGALKSSRDFWTAVCEDLAKEEISKHDILVWDDDQENVDAARKYGLQAEFYKNFEVYKNKMAKLTMPRA